MSTQYNQVFYFIAILRIWKGQAPKYSKTAAAAGEGLLILSQGTHAEKDNLYQTVKSEIFPALQ